MNVKLPVLIIIPHGGRDVPDELSGLEQVDEFGLFIESDVCANEIFGFTDIKKIKTNISRLFIDIDRQFTGEPPYPDDWIIKKESINGRTIFKEGIFPDKTAVSNLIARYYTPFHEAIEYEMKDSEIKLILECHTMMPVGPRFAGDSGKPRPLINIENIIHSLKPVITCPHDQTEFFLSCMKKYFNNEEYTVSEKFSMNRPKTTGFLMEKFGQEVWMLRLSVSSSLFLNDKYFNYESLSVDMKRISEIREKIRLSIEKFSVKYL